MGDIYDHKAPHRVEKVHLDLHLVLHVLYVL
jgi:hypothetical protein